MLYRIPRSVFNVHIGRCFMAESTRCKFIISDFDQTITQHHTFSSNKAIINPTAGWKDAQYHLGKSHAQNNLKKNVELFIKHDDFHLCAIATFHNNPDFIAGYMAVLLGKELIYKATISPKSDTEIAIDIFETSGLKKPLLISRLTLTGEAYLNLMNTHPDKNRQIEHIRAVWEALGYMNKSDLIHFFDDSIHNIKQSASLPHLENHQVIADSPRFMTSPKASDRHARISLMGYALADGYSQEDSSSETDSVDAPGISGGFGLFKTKLTPQISDTHQKIEHRLNQSG